MSLSFEGRVVIVTGAGGGLGREYAIEFAKRGGKVVVNDLGTTFDGKGKKTSEMADKVVNEIKRNGGEAVADYNSVENGEEIVKTAITKYGRIDIIINNAGILRDKSFVKMSQSDWDLVYKVHLLGCYKVCKAAWPYMREQGFGRIVMTCSGAGLYGNFGQANYSAMKLAQLGFANTLSKEGAKRNILTNTIAPLAGSRLTATIFPPDIVATLKPAFVYPLVLWLCHPDCKVNGDAFEVGAGWIARVQFERNTGHTFPAVIGDKGIGFGPEDVRDNWDKIVDWKGTSHPKSLDSTVNHVFGMIEEIKKRKAGGITTSPAPGSGGVLGAIGYAFPSITSSFTSKDLILYSLGIGIGLKNPLSDANLAFVYENHPKFQAFPTFGVTFGFSSIMGLSSVPGLDFNPMMLLHGEQYIQLPARKSIPSGGADVETESVISNIYDKGKGALVIIRTTTKNKKTGSTICINEYSLFIRGMGGFGGARGPSDSEKAKMEEEKRHIDLPKKGTEPTTVVEELTLPSQALIYRWGGADPNPLHVDPNMATIAGFNGRPILHGLCTLGFAARTVLSSLGLTLDDAASNLKALKARFTRHVFPGETIVTETWRDDRYVKDRIFFRCHVKERKNEGYVINNAYVDLHPSATSKL